MTLSSDQVNEIRHVLPLEDLIVLTADGEWRVSGGTEAISATNIIARKQGGVGCSHVRPLIVGGSILFVQNKGSRVRDLAYTFSSDRYQTADLSLLSNHLVESETIEEWTFSQAPHNIIWCVRSDGIMLGLTYIKEVA